MFVRFLKACAIILLTIVVAWKLNYPTNSYRIRLTLNVETPNGPISGSSVMEVTATRVPAWFDFKTGTHATHASLTGEAVYVDLGSDGAGNSRNLVALLAWGPHGTGPDFYFLPNRVFIQYLQDNQNARNERMRRALQFGYQSGQQNKKLSEIGCGYDGDHYCELGKLPIGTVGEVRGTTIPTLVTIPNLNDPKSAKAVQPDNLQEAFGPGFQLRNVTLEFVSSGSWPLNVFGLGGEHVTRDIETKLPNIFRALRDPSNKAPFSEKIGAPFILRISQLKQKG